MTMIEVELIRRLGELIKGIGSALIEYADNKKKQLSASIKRHDELLNARKTRS